jgi:adenosine kinase
VACVFDPGQGLPILDAPVLLEAITGSAVFIVNGYEWELTCENTGLDEDAIAERVGALVVTRGEEGSMLRRGGLDVGLRTQHERLDIPVVKAERVLDPTGCGDAYRAGLLYGIVNDLPLDTGARLGSLMGSLKVARPGPQSIELDLAGIRESYEAEFGESL